MTRNAARLAATVTALCALAVAAGPSAARAQDDTTYQDLVQLYSGWTRSDVVRAGYVVDTTCVTAADEGLPADLGAMGYHAVNAEYVADGVADPVRPDAILLDATDSIVGVEYEVPEVVDPPPTVLGVPLELTPPHMGMDYEHMSRHVYFVGAEQDRYAPFNPAVTCPAESGAAATNTGLASEMAGGAVASDPMTDTMPSGNAEEPPESMSDTMSGTTGDMTTTGQTGGGAMSATGPASEMSAGGETSASAPMTDTARTTKGGLPVPSTSMTSTAAGSMPGAAGGAYPQPDEPENMPTTGLAGPGWSGIDLAAALALGLAIVAFFGRRSELARRL